MVTFTIVDFWKYDSRFPKNCTLGEEKVEYKTKEENKNKETHQYHDKIFKELLDDKKEFISFIKKYVGEEIELKEEEIEKYNRKFINTNFKVRESDIIYKIKDKEIFIIVEQQSKIDYKMPERMTEYCLEIIRSREYKSKFIESPIICPIVLYTGRKKWDAARTIVQEKDEYYGFPPLEYPKYNLVDINDYTKEGLLEERTGISKAMLFEKLETKEEIEETLDKIIRRGTSIEERKYLSLILKYSNDIAKKLDKDTVRKYQEKIEGGDSMTNFERLYIELLDDKYEKGMKAGESQGRKIGEVEGRKIGEAEGRKIGEVEGRKIGEAEGKRNGIIQVAKEMIKNKMKDSDILKVTHISKEKLEELKLQKV